MCVCVCVCVCANVCVCLLRREEEGETAKKRSELKERKILCKKNLSVLRRVCVVYFIFSNLLSLVHLREIIFLNGGLLFRGFLVKNEQLFIVNLKFSFFFVLSTLDNQ